MSRTGFSSTPLKAKESESTTNKKRLPSPFSPEDHTAKKNKQYTSDSDTSNSSYESELKMAETMDSSSALLAGLGFGMGVPPEMTPEMLKTVTIIRAFLGEDMRDLIKTAVKDALDSGLSDLREDNERLTKENNELRTRVEKLEASQDDSEQYSRCNSLRVSNVEETADENTDRIVLYIGNTIDADLTMEAIDRSHRVGKPVVRKTRDILVKFVTYRARKSLYTMRKHLKGSEYDGVFLNEDFTKSRSKLLFDARMKVKGYFLRGAWSTDGRLFIKDNKGQSA